MDFQKTKATAKSVVDGIAAYAVFYFWTSLLIWGGVKMLDLFSAGFWQVLGALIIARQLIAVVKNPPQQELPKKEPATKIEKDETPIGLLEKTRLYDNHREALTILAENYGFFPPEKRNRAFKIAKDGVDLLKIDSKVGA